VLGSLQWLYAPANREVIARRTRPGVRHELRLPQPPDPHRFAFVVFGDTGDSDFLGSGETPQDAVARLVAAEAALPGSGGDARLVLHTGDVVYMTGERRLYDRNFRRPYAPFLEPGSTFDRLTFRLPFLPVPGNHDYYDFPRWAGLVARIPVLGRGLKAAARGVFAVSLPQGGSDMGATYMEAFVARDRDGATPLDYLPGVATRLPNRYYRFRAGDVECFALDSNTLDVLPPGAAPGEGAAAGRRERRLDQEAAALERELLVVDAASERARGERRRAIAATPAERAAARAVAEDTTRALSALAAALAAHDDGDSGAASGAVRDARNRWVSGCAALAKAASADTAVRALEALDQAAEGVRTALARAEDRLVRLPQGPGHADADAARETVERSLGAWVALTAATLPELEARRRTLAEDSLEVQRERARERQRRAPKPADHDHAQLEWLDRALDASIRERPDGWRIAVLHHPPFTSIRAYCEGAELREIRANLLSRLAGRVHAVFAGHAHAFEWIAAGPLAGTALFVTGGGGQVTLGRSVFDPRHRERDRPRRVALREAGVQELAYAARGPAASDGASGRLWHFLRVEVTAEALRVIPVGVRRTETGYRRETPLPVLHARLDAEDRPWEVRRLAAVEIRRDAPPRPLWEEETLLVIANRSAGALSRGGTDALLDAARGAGFEPELAETGGARQFLRVLESRVLKHESRVAIAGGDGTLHLAVQVLAGSDVTLGIVPQGTANNVATTLGLPRDPAQAFAVIAAGRTRTIDLGRANGMWFTEAAGVGLFADLLHVTQASHGVQAVLRGAKLMASTVLFRHPRHITLVLDGEPVAGRVLNVIAANTALVGYNVAIAPDAVLEDRRLDVVVIEPLDLFELVRYWWALRRGQHLELPKVQRYRARHVRILTRRSARAHVDDRCALRTPLEIEAVAGALRVFVGDEPPVIPGAAPAG
jgi:diacylglycerol kinase (ATP)